MVFVVVTMCLGAGPSTPSVPGPAVDVIPPALPSPT